MPKVNRSNTYYFKLPRELATSAIPDAKLMISVSVTAPKGMEKAAQRTIMKILDESKDTFKKRFKKEVEKMAEDDDEEDD